jgi:hypothetical protein
MAEKGTVIQAEIKLTRLKDGQEKVLSNPTLTMLAGKPSRFVVGGEEPIPGTTPVQYEPTGVIMSILVTATGPELCSVRMYISHVTKQPSGDDSLVLNSKVMDYRGKWKLNEPKTLNLGDTDDIKDLKAEVILKVVGKGSQP